MHQRNIFFSVFLLHPLSLDSVSMLSHNVLTHARTFTGTNLAHLLCIITPSLYLCFSGPQSSFQHSQTRSEKYRHLIMCRELPPRIDHLCPISPPRCPRCPSNKDSREETGTTLEGPHYSCYQSFSAPFFFCVDS